MDEPALVAATGSLPDLVPEPGAFDARTPAVVDEPFCPDEMDMASSLNIFTS